MPLQDSDDTFFLFKKSKKRIENGLLSYFFDLTVESSGKIL